MQEALCLLSELDEEDVAWIMEQSREQQVIANTLIIQEGERPETLFIILEGLVGIEMDAIGSQMIAFRGAGELLGEISFLDGETASATVKAVENSLLLAIPRSLLDVKLAEDPSFAARFYRSCARIVARRLRDRVGQVGQQVQEKSQQASAVTTAWGRVSGAIESMKEQLRKADQAAIRNQGEVPEELAAEVVEGFAQAMAFLNTEVGEASGLSASVQQEVGQ